MNQQIRQPIYGFTVTDVAVMHELLFGPQDHNEHVKEFKLEQKVRASREATQAFMAEVNDWLADIRARRTK